MKPWLNAVFVLAITTSAIGLDLSRLQGIKDQLLKNVEDREQQEITVFRQSICLAYHRGVLPCPIKYRGRNVMKLAKPEENIDNNEKYSIENSEAEETSSLVEKKLLTPKIVESISVEDLEPSNLEQQDFSKDTKKRSEDLRVKTPEMDELNNDFVRQGRYLMIPGYNTKNVATEPPSIHVTKVIESPVTATLVVKNCIPKIGIPPCNKHWKPNEEVPTVMELSQKSKEDYLIEKSQLSADEQESLWMDVINPNYDDDKSEEQAKSRFIEETRAFFGKPSVVETEGELEVKPVIVVETTVKPGLLGTIFKPFFNIFNKVPQKPEVVIIEKPEPPIIIIDEKTNAPYDVKLAERSWKDLHNDSVLEKLEDDERVEKPRFLGDVVSNIVSSVPISAILSLFQNFGNFLSKPFTKYPIGQKPAEQPIGIQSPIYTRTVGLKPLDISNKEKLKSLFAENEVDHEVFQDPFYVSQERNGQSGPFKRAF